MSLLHRTPANLPQMVGSPGAYALRRFHGPDTPRRWGDESFPRARFICARAKPMRIAAGDDQNCGLRVHSPRLSPV